MHTLLTHPDPALCSLSRDIAEIRKVDRGIVYCNSIYLNAPLNKSITRPFDFSRYKYKILFRSSFTIRKSVILTLISPYPKNTKVNIVEKLFS